MEKQFNDEWMAKVLNSKDVSDDYSGSLPDIEWIRYNNGFKKGILFKMLPANSRENNVFAYIVSTHWLTDSEGKTHRFVCPEQTVHLANQKVKCPVCEAKRQLLKAGFTEEELSVPGKFGPMPVFDGKLTSNIKVVVLKTDTKQDWDKSHVSILQQNGSYLAIWLAQKWREKEVPNFMDYESSNPIKFSRPTDSGKWEREFSFQMFQPTQDVLDKIKAENEALYMPDIWRMPSDQDFMEITNVVDELKNQYMKAKETVTSASTSVEESTSTSTSDFDEVPF